MERSMRTLVTGFEAFNGKSVNPTSLMIEAIHQGKLALNPGIALEALVLPVTFETSFSIIENKINEFKPDLILCFGLAGGRASIELERIAINCMDAEIPDNLGNSPRDLCIDPHGPDGIFTNLPLKELAQELRSQNIHCRISNSAGTYVCNYLFYRVLKLIKNSSSRAGFIHVPWHRDQGESGPAISTEELLRALQIMLKYLHTHQQ
jgi:pyroglutamyl-peptidase